jgi:hypothetical protein
VNNKHNKIMTTTTTELPAINTEFKGTATYCPEDNKLRLYVGRVPRDEYLKLRAEGWTALPKQRESGKGDFAAVWTPQRRNTALAYAGAIDDEDAGPAERAADRAERFALYRDKRTTEAALHADRFDSTPSAHGFQSQARAERSAARHDAMAGRAVDSWEKAEYWQRRTGSVIDHALYVAAPGVRMGRIKTLEADLRRFEKSPEHYPNWIVHTKLRLEYEKQMLAAQGGRLEQFEVVPGGKLGGKLIIKVSKSPVTGRAVSCDILGAKVNSWTYRATNILGTEYAAHKFDLERFAPNAYTPPTPESLAELAAFNLEREAKAPKKIKVPLINPTEADAERLQALWNDWAKIRHCESHMQSYGKDYAEQFVPATICRITQATYSAASEGTYGRAETEQIIAGGKRFRSLYRSEKLKVKAAVCSIRTTLEKFGAAYTPPRVVILTDKPQKVLPAEIWIETAQVEANAVAIS